MAGDERKVADTKHLEFLQAVITRLAGNSFLIKGWSVTLTTAIIGFAVKDAGPGFALVGLAPVAVFALLDAYYLGLEKAFRDRFDIAAAAYVAGEPPDFDMSSRFGIGSFFRAVGWPAVLGLHGLLGVLLVATYILLCSNP